MKLFLVPADSFIIMKPIWDTLKIKEIWHYFKILMTSSTTTYGISFYAFILVVILNVKSIFKRKDMINLLFIIFVSTLFYLILLYQIDYSKFDKLENVILVSTKRFMFCYIPIVWFYIFANRTSFMIFENIDKWLSFKR